MVKGYFIVISAVLVFLLVTPAAGQIGQRSEGLSEPDNQVSENSEHSVPTTKGVDWSPSAKQMSAIRLSSAGVYSGVLTLDHGNGLEVMRVSAPSPAYSAGLQAGDIVTALNGNRVMNTSQLSHQLRRVRAGELSYWTIKRDGQIEVKPVRLVARSERPEPEFIYFNLRSAGLVLFQSVETEEIYIETVRQQSSSFESGLEPGDQIIQISGEEVISLNEVDRLLSRKDKDHNLIVLRDGTALDIMLLK